MLKRFWKTLCYGSRERLSFVLARDVTARYRHVRARLALERARGAGRGAWPRAAIGRACKSAAPCARAITAQRPTIVPRKNSPTRPSSFVGNMSLQKRRNAHNKKRQKRPDDATRRFLLSIYVPATRPARALLATYPNIAESSLLCVFSAPQKLDRSGTEPGSLNGRERSQLATRPLLLNRIYIECHDEIRTSGCNAQLK